MGEMLRLIRQNDVKPADVEKIDLGKPRHGDFVAASSANHGTAGEIQYGALLSILLLDARPD